MLHASAVEIGQFCVAFLGASGRGKSTLAAVFARAGFRFLTDDGLTVTRRGDRYIGGPSHPSLRLWDDSQRAILWQGTAQAPAVQYTQKARFLAGESLPFCDEDRDLRILYVLGNGDSHAPVFEPMTPSESLIELLKNSFLLETEEPEVLARHFDELATLARVVQVCRFDYPRQFLNLEAVRAAVHQHALKQ